MTQFVVTLCGGDRFGKCNGAHVAAGVLGSKSHKCTINVLTRQAAKWGNTMTIYTPDGSTLEGNIACVTQDPSKALACQSQHNLQFCVYLTDIPLLKMVAPHVKEGALIGTLFTQAGFNWMVQKYIKDIHPKGDTITTFGIQYIPWMSRIREYGRAGNLLGPKKFLHVAVLPKTREQHVKDVIEYLFDQKVVIVPTFLAMTLTTSNQIIHPARYYGIFKDWDFVTPYNKADMPMLYADMDQFSGEMLQHLSDELMAVKAGLVKRYPQLDQMLTSVIPLKDRVKLIYGEQQMVFKTNYAYSKITTPVMQAPGFPDRQVIPDMNSRLLWDDVPFGLCILKDFANQLGLEVPNIDVVLEWHQKLMKKEYVVNGKLVGRDVSEAGIMQNYGIASLDDLIRIDAPSA